jgi:type I site-specific restriction endonuclease
MTPALEDAIAALHEAGEELKKQVEKFKKGMEMRKYDQNAPKVMMLALTKDHAELLAEILHREFHEGNTGRPALEAQQIHQMWQVLQMGLKG